MWLLPGYSSIKIFIIFLPIYSAAWRFVMFIVLATQSRKSQGLIFVSWQNRKAVSNVGVICICSIFEMYDWLIHFPSGVLASAICCWDIFFINRIYLKTLQTANSGGMVLLSFVTLQSDLNGFRVISINILLIKAYVDGQRALGSCLTEWLYHLYYVNVKLIGNDMKIIYGNFL